MAALTCLDKKTGKSVFGVATHVLTLWAVSELQQVEGLSAALRVDMKELTRAQLRSAQRGAHRLVRLVDDGGRSRVDHERRQFGAAPRHRGAGAEESRGLERHERRVGEVAAQREQRGRRVRRHVRG